MSMKCRLIDLSSIGEYQEGNYLLCSDEHLCPELDVLKNCKLVWLPHQVSLDLFKRRYDDCEEDVDHDQGHGQGVAEDHQRSDNARVFDVGKLQLAQQHAERGFTGDNEVAPLVQVAVEEHEEHDDEPDEEDSENAPKPYHFIPASLHGLRQETHPLVISEWYT